MIKTMTHAPEHVRETTDPSTVLGREVAIGKLSRLLAGASGGQLGTYERGLDAAILEGDAHHGRLGVVGALRNERDRDGCRARILSKASMMNGQVVGSYVDLVESELTG